MLEKYVDIDGRQKQTSGDNNKSESLEVCWRWWQWIENSGGEWKRYKEGLGF